MRDAAVPVRANYISNLALAEASGGWSGFNAAIHESLKRYFELTYVGPVSPPRDIPARIVSKLRRTTGLPGAFHFFSPHRLREIARVIESQASSDAELDFFHGATPWVAYAPPVPYACYLDVCFATYVSIYHDRREFSNKDLDRICTEEAAWLRTATRVFFSSSWGLESAVSAYGLARDNLKVVGLGGHIPIPDCDRYQGGFEFLFIALDFRGKGGQVCLDAFWQLRQQYPEARLRIVGERPPDRALSMPGVVYEGLLKKSVPADLLRLREILSMAFVLVHPTKKDVTPQVIVEAQYFGCPVIAPRSFGIPEMVVDGVNGCLVNAPPSADAVALRMLELCADKDVYDRMRAAARANALDRFIWAKVGDRMASEMCSAID